MSLRLWNIPICHLHKLSEEIFVADWNRSTVQFNDPNLVVSPINSRNDFTTLINSARSTLLIEAEEMNDSDIEQAIANAAQHGVQVEVILPVASTSSGDSHSQGIASIKQSGAQVREDAQLYMHAKIIVVDNRVAFVGSENISAQSLGMLGFRPPQATPLQSVVRRSGLEPLIQILKVCSRCCILAQRNGKERRFTWRKRPRR